MKSLLLSLERQEEILRNRKVLFRIPEVIRQFRETIFKLLIEMFGLRC
jgi:hypothetical protein